MSDVIFAVQGLYAIIFFFLIAILGLWRLEGAYHVAHEVRIIFDLLQELF